MNHRIHNLLILFFISFNIHFKEGTYKRQISCSNISRNRTIRFMDVLYRN